MRLPYLTSKLQGLGTTIFAEMQALAVQHSAVDLGQGSPRFDPDERVVAAAVEAMHAGHNQYAPASGVPALRAAIAAHQQQSYGLVYDTNTEITVTAGATEALCATLLSLCETGDEVIVFEPFYDSYRAGIAMAGAVARVVPLVAPEFGFDPESLSAAFNDRTRLLLLNTPHNPTGKVFGQDELAQIAALCIEHDILAVTDEVYEHLVYEGQHVPLASLPGMRERTLTISSAGKTFSCTGWKVGWVCAPAPLTTAVRTAKQFITFSNGTPFQHAIAVGLGLDLVPALLEGYRSRRQQLVSGLQGVGFDVMSPQGAFFVNVDVRSVGFSSDVEFCRVLPVDFGVVAIPCSGFFADPRDVTHLARFAFCKTETEIDEGLRRLAALGG